MILVNLLQNVALLVLLSAVLQLITRRWQVDSIWRRTVTGLLYGSVAIAGMLTPLTVSPGVIFDGRSILITVAGVFGGPVTALIAALATSIARLAIGGAGAWVGVAVIFESMAAGLAFRALLRRKPVMSDSARLWALGVVVHVLMLLLMYALPGGIAPQVLRQIALPIVIVYPLAFVLVSWLILDMQQRMQDEVDLRNLNESLESQVAERTHALSAMNERLAAESEAKTRFLRSMSHELRTPLNSIIGFSDILGKGMAGELTEEQQRQIEMIGGAGKHLLALINDILDLSRIEAGAIQVESERVDARKTVDEVVAALAPEASDKGLDLTAEVGTTEVFLMSDSRKLSQILLNLIGNAVKFTDAGMITIALSQMPGAVSFAVSDTGVGIAEGELESIFAEFNQGDRQPDRHQSGTGLGLAISRGLAEMLGGRIDVESELGKGSTFTLVLPSEH